MFWLIVSLLRRIWFFFLGRFGDSWCFVLSDGRWSYFLLPKSCVDGYIYLVLSYIWCCNVLLILSYWILAVWTSGLLHAPWNYVLHVMASLSIFDVRLLQRKHKMKWLHGFVIVLILFRYLNDLKNKGWDGSVVRYNQLAIFMDLIVVWSVFIRAFDFFLKVDSRFLVKISVVWYLNPQDKWYYRL